MVRVLTALEKGCVSRVINILSSYHDLKTIGRFSNRTGTSFDNGARKSNNWLDQWQSGKLGTRSRVSSFLHAFTSSTDVPVLLLNHQPNDTSTTYFSSNICKWTILNYQPTFTYFWKIIQKPPGDFLSRVHPFPPQQCHNFSWLSIENTEMK